MPVAQNRSGLHFAEMQPAAQMDDLDALRLMHEWGVDEVLGALPLDRTRQIRPDARPRSEPSFKGATAPTRPASSETAHLQQANTLEALHRALDQFTACALRATATNTVRPAGNLAARTILIGDAPGPEDDRSGQAFSGPHGQMLKQVLGSAGLGEDLLLTTLVPWRPPGSRPLNEAELRQCLPFLVRLVDLVRPDRLVLVGQWPARLLLGSNEPIRKLRGRWRDAAMPFQDAPIPTLIFPPLDHWWRNSAAKQELWSDLLLLTETILEKRERNTRE